MAFKFSLKSVALATLFTALPICASATVIGGAGPGGGDSCEARFKEVAQDIHSFLIAGGAARIDFSKSQRNVTRDQYEKGMLYWLDLFQQGKVHVRCLDK